MSIRNTILISALLIAFLSACASKPTSPSELFAAMIMTKEQQSSSVPTDSGVLLRNPESGSWKRLGPAIQMISSATVDPSNPQVIFFACGNGIVRSTDGGTTWRMVTGWRESDALQIAIDPQNGDLVYAATAWGVTVSRDGGDSWESANNGLPEYFSKGIVIDQRDTSRLLLATTTGLFESTDRARTWQRIDSFPTVAALRLRRSQSNPDLWIAGTEGQGVWISSDDGNTWQATSPGLAGANVYAVAINFKDDALLAAGGWDTGVHVSNDGGSTWKLAVGSLPSPNITAMTFDENNPGRLWISTFEEGSYFSDDLGLSWTTANLDGAYVFDLGFLPPKPGGKD